MEGKETIIIVEGGYRSGKTIFLVYCAKKAQQGGKNKMLRRVYMNRYQVMANLGLFFDGKGVLGQPIKPVCDHKPYLVVDWRYKTSEIRTCTCKQLGVPGGNLNPLDLAQRAFKQREFPPYTSIVGHEWHRWQESRITSMLPRKSQLNRLFMNYLADETGKAHMDFLIDTQNRYKVDNRLRDFAGYLIVCENLANDVEHDPPTSLHYTVVRDPFAFHPQVQEFYPKPSWGMALKDLYDTWEQPRYKTEAESAVEEAEEDLTKMEKNIKRLENVDIPDPELEYEGRRAQRKVVETYAKIRSQQKRAPIATVDLKPRASNLRVRDAQDARVHS